MSIAKSSFSVFDNNPFADNLFNWMNSPEGILFEQIRELTWEMLDTVSVNVEHRRLIWEDGKELTIEQSAHRINDTVEPDQGVSAELIASEIHGWLEMGYVPENLNPAEMRRFEKSIGKWLAADKKEKQRQSS